ncbi:neprilysin-2-like [Macrosteles quadrilineatus]|uniref:neprilysin-2-like n=1 Tax=Macrosteles quadrilineatus TaxID=74068 RepID=UPI0023E3305D|nr:neprilysin-2-like [Macrosteles quadrilineatus]
MDVCKTEACESLSQRMLSSIDFSARPCDDFYRFACRRFEDTAEIDYDQAENSSIPQVKVKLQEQLKVILSEKPNPDDPLPYRNLKNLFSLCMDEEAINSRGISHAVALLQKAGGWPVLGNWQEENWDFLDTEIKLRNLSIGGGNLFHVYISIDTKNTTRRILMVDQANLGLFRDYLIRGEEDPAVKDYYNYMVDMAVLYGADRETAKKQLRDCLLFEIELAKLTVPNEERRDFDRMYNIYTLPDLTKEIPWVDWKKLLKSIMPEDVPLRENEMMNVKEVNFLKELEKLLSKHPNQVLANYMGWHAANGLSGALTDEMRNRKQEYKSTLLGTTARDPRWKECVGVANRDLKIALASLYVKRFFDKTSRKEAFDMAEKIRQEMYKVLQEVDWMDNVTRSQALYKVQKIQEYIGYPDELLDISKIEQLYEGLVLDGKHYLEERLKLSRWGENYAYRQLREPVNNTDWREHSDVAIVNAEYKSYENSILIPAGILQLPFFDAKLPKYVNYAAIGFFMAHEITHGFDDQGSQFDFNGDLKEWWTEGSRNIFNEKKRCFIDQYSNFVDSKTSLHLNGINTQGENLADNGGIKLAYRAYKRLNLNEPRLPGLQNYTQDQLFMLSMATMWCTRYRPQILKLTITSDVHSPAEFRVNGPLKNFPEFSKIFRCSDNDAMNPRHRCVVW